MVENTDIIDFTKRNPNCTLCGLHKKAQTVCIWGEGPTSDVMIVGLGPGADEDKKGRPFVGRSGTMLNNMLQTIDLPREHLYISNAVKCRPPNNEPKAEEIRLCYNYLREEIEQKKPKLVVAVGAIAWWALQGKKTSESMEKLIGKVFPLRKFPDIQLMVAVHPAAVLRNRANEKKYISSWIAVRKYLDGLVLDPTDLGDYENIYDYGVAIEKLREVAAAKHFSFDLETGFDESTIDVAWVNRLNEKFMGKAALRWEFPGFFLKSVSISLIPHEAFCIPFNYPVTADQSRWYWKPAEEQSIKALLVHLFENPEIAKCAHNVNYDRHSGERALPCKFQGQFHDTAMMHFLQWDYKPHNLEDIAWDETKIGNYPQAVDSAGGVQNAHGEALFLKNNVDSDVTERLVHKYPPMMQKENVWDLYRNVVLPGLDSLYALEEEGFPVDLDRWDQLRKRSDELYKEKRSFLENHQLAKQVSRELNVTFNPNSDKHLRHLFFTIQGHTPIKNTKVSQKPSTDEEVLTYLDEEKNAPLAREILMYKKVAKLKSTYIDGMRPMVAPDGRIHARYNLHIARTGRTSSDNPNLQNIPKGWDERKFIQDLLGQLDVREVFIGGEGWTLAEYDFNQHELRVTAMASHDPVLTDAYRTDPAKDIHSVTASGLCQRRGYEWNTYEAFLAAHEAGRIDLVDKVRRDAKILNFGLIYGKTVAGVMRDLKCDKDTAVEYFDGFWDLYAGIKVWKDREEMNVELKGQTVSLFGQIRKFPWARDWQAKKQGVNHIVQNTASMLMIVGLTNFLALRKKYGFKTRPCAEVHDSILFLIHNSELETMKQVIPQVLENPKVDFLHVPLKVDCKFGERWSELH